MNGNGEVHAKGFGAEINAKGTNVVNILLIVALGALIWVATSNMTEKVMAAQKVELDMKGREHMAIVDTQKEMVASLKELVSVLRTIECKMSFTEAERRGMRLALERGEVPKDEVGRPMNIWCR